MFPPPLLIVKKNEYKQKLTLGLNRDVIEKAKAAGINISAITEELLTALTYEVNEGNTKIDVVRAYEALFKAFGPILRQYGTGVRVGSLMVYTSDRTKLEEKPLYFAPSNGIYRREDNDIKQYQLDKILHRLFKPKTLLHNLIMSLISAAQKNKDKIKELELALRFVKALSDEETQK